MSDDYTILDQPWQIERARALTIRSALRLELAGLRGRGPALPLAQGITGVKYPKSRKGKEQAIADLTALLDGGYPQQAGTEDPPQT